MSLHTASVIIELMLVQYLNHRTQNCEVLFHPRFFAPDIIDLCQHYNLYLYNNEANMMLFRKIVCVIHKTYLSFSYLYSKLLFHKGIRSEIEK
jgi:hypothetical protein